MATLTSIAIRRDAAFERLVAAIAALKGAATIPFSPPKGADMREMALVEWAADELESVGGKTKPKSEPLTVLAEDAASEGVTLDVEETRDGTPVVVTKGKLKR